MGRFSSQFAATVLATALFSTAVALGAWVAQPGPRAPVLSVALINRASRDIRRIEIQHGNLDTEERIVVLRIPRGGEREIGLNHQPGKGFSMRVIFADGEEMEVCAGKLDEVWYISQVIKDDDLLTIGGRWRD
jgi:hypothetical protein